MEQSFSKSSSLTFPKEESKCAQADCDYSSYQDFGRGDQAECALHSCIKALKERTEVVGLRHCLQMSDNVFKAARNQLTKISEQDSPNHDLTDAEEEFLVQSEVLIEALYERYNKIKEDTKIQEYQHIEEESKVLLNDLRKKLFQMEFLDQKTLKMIINSPYKASEFDSMPKVLSNLAISSNNMKSYMRREDTYTTTLERKLKEKNKLIERYKEKIKTLKGKLKKPNSSNVSSIDEPNSHPISSVQNIDESQNNDPPINDRGMSIHANFESLKSLPILHDTIIQIEQDYQNSSTENNPKTTPIYNLKPNILLGVRNRVEEPLQLNLQNTSSGSSSSIQTSIIVSDKNDFMRVAPQLQNFGIISNDPSISREESKDECKNVNLILSSCSVPIKNIKSIAFPKEREPFHSFSDSADQIIIENMNNVFTEFSIKLDSDFNDSKRFEEVKEKVGMLEKQLSEDIKEIKDDLKDIKEAISNINTNSEKNISERYITKEDLNEALEKYSKSTTTKEETKEMASIYCNDNLQKFHEQILEKERIAHQNEMKKMKLAYQKELQKYKEENQKRNLANEKDNNEKENHIEDNKEPNEEKDEALKNNIPQIQSDKECKIEPTKEEPSKPKLEPDDTPVVIDGTEQKIKEISELQFELDEEEGIKLIKQLIPYKMPPLQELTFYLEDNPQSADLANEFLSDSICEHIQLLDFYAPISSLSITPLMASLSKVLPLVSQEVYFRFFYLSPTEVGDLLVAAKTAKQVRIQQCTIKGDGQLDFGGRLKGATFEELDFSRTYFESEGGDEIFFRNVAKGLVEVESVKSRKIKMVLDDDYFNEENAVKILEEFGLTKIELCFI